MQGELGTGGLGNAKRLVRREEQQRKANDTAQDRVVGRARASRVQDTTGARGTRGHNGAEDRSKSRAGWSAWQEVKREWKVQARPGNGISGQDWAEHV